ncbi:hypothetical protein SODALDRAFT_113400 [Sodiomyces alkalinus F11]|uniref:Uncharacterized protein n=1 Tax=Sodiomyces alkalinus (strain CBS 110278 / VKM F-3762 / F11) TaxID=1314773 RepID=A0A3N2Q335_SODAK|nr:hypothetical protein SODALDRAFT_113400 [Sodiomyces alkalinus F11]ROT41173.1 hypothetical protein SODALDRAFT_113400 [Sodiomyces alkalinus F11]
MSPISYLPGRTCLARKTSFFPFFFISFSSIPMGLCCWRLSRAVSFFVSPTSYHLSHRYGRLTNRRKRWQLNQELECYTLIGFEEKRDGGKWKRKPGHQEPGWMYIRLEQARNRQIYHIHALGQYRLGYGRQPLVRRPVELDRPRGEK